MKLWAWGAVGASTFAFTLFACGGGSKGVTGSANTGGAGSEAMSSSTSLHVSSTVGRGPGPTGTGGSGGSGGGMGNHTIQDATMVSIDAAPTMGTLVAVGTPDFYTFTTTMANERLFIAVQSTDLNGQAFDPTVIDPAFGLYDASMNLMMPLTYQNGAWPYFSQDAEVLVELATPGQYYIGLSDCNGFFMSGCPNPPSGITGFDYELLVLHPSSLNAVEVNAAATQTGMIAGAQTVTYKVSSMAGDYESVIFDGNFKNATDTHVYSFTPPMDTTTAMGATPRAEFYVQPIGSFQGGDISDANVKIWITDSTGNVILSQDDQNHYPTNSMAYTPLQFSAPVTLGTQYYLFVQNTQASGSPAMDYYFIRHYLNPLIDVAEKEPATMTGQNDTSAMAEALTAQGSSHDFYTVDGHIAMNATDVDWFSFTVPATTTQYVIQCDSARSGSGLGGFTAELFKSDATTSIVKLTESATTDLQQAATALPSGVTAGTKLFLKVTAASQDAMDTGTQYRCYVFFQ
jgi:hypothetical protein